MWFKRRKKSEQDHALSESLRSLQSLLSETGRREPSLDPSNTPADDEGVAPSAGSRPGMRRALTAQQGGSGSATRARPPEPDHSAARSAEPGAAVDSGNRWRDLNLSFDAEPVLPRARRSSDGGAKPPDTTPEPPAAPQTKPAPTTRALETVIDDNDSPAKPDAGPPTAPAGHDESMVSPANATSGPPSDGDAEDDAEQAEPDVVTYGLGSTTPAPGGEAPQEVTGSETTRETSDLPSAGDEQSPSDYEIRSRSDDEVLMIDLDEPEPSPPGGVDPEATEPVEIVNADSESPASNTALDDPAAAPDDAAQVDDAMQDVESPESPRQSDAASGMAAVEPDTPAPVRDEVGPEDTAGPPREAENEENEENQLHLKLESDEASEADIPVLTNAVYVPDASPEQTAPPGAAESPHEASVERFMDNFRARLQLMGIATLSAAQEKELCDAVVELLDELEGD